MDKYSLKALKEIGIGYYFVVKEKQLSVSYDLGVLENNKLVINQDEDINIVDYQFVILEKDELSPIESVQIERNGKFVEIKPAKPEDVKDYDWFTKLYRIVTEGKRAFIVPISFQNRATKLKITYKHNFIDPIVFELEYKESSKEVYYQKVAENNRKSLIEKAQIKLATGNDLVNVYFQPCTDECAKTVIELYSQGMLLGKFNVEEGLFFKSITGLAYGSYEIKVIQYDKNGKELFASDPYPFKLSAPNYGGKHTVII